jgi:hypothetical protein
MYDPLTYRYPRTMQEAFGPFTDNTLEPIQEEEHMDIQDKIVMVASVLAAIACAIVIALEGKV